MLPRNAFLLRSALAVAVMMMATLRSSDVVVRSLNTASSSTTKSIKRVAIVGGGLAGLSVAHHLIEESSQQVDENCLDITIFDRCSGPGIGGASAVAGGLLHPLSPRGKLVYLGLEGLASSGRLIDFASKYNPQTILRNQLYRIATDTKQVETLTKTATELPDIATWYDVSRLDSLVGTSKEIGLSCYHEDGVLGALMLHSGCKVIHVPSYLDGLWRSCQTKAKGETRWQQIDEVGHDISSTWTDRLADFDCVVFAAGSGLFQSNPIIDRQLPLQLVRGQSIEMAINTTTLNEALLSGKYISPLPDRNKILIGATHEFKPDPLTPHEVVAELKYRSVSFASFLWDDQNDGVIERITSGYRVQTSRGKHGRLPIIGRIDTKFHPCSWIFTGLSSRGLLYHGIYGEMLSEMILGGSRLSKDGLPNRQRLELDWWHI